MSFAIRAVRRFELIDRLTVPLSSSHQVVRPLIHYWRSTEDSPYSLRVFVKGVKGLPPDLTRAHVILPQGGEMAARDMLGHGAERVLFADAAIAEADPSVMQGLVQTLGADKVGVWLPVKRTGNPCKARMTTPLGDALYSHTAAYESPCWEVLYSDNKRTGINACWWIGQMLQQGVSCILLSVDFVDEHDYTLTAMLANQCEEHLWLSPLTQQLPEWKMNGWMQQGNIRQFVLDQDTTPKVDCAHYDFF